MKKFSMLFKKVNAVITGQLKTVNTPQNQDSNFSIWLNVYFEMCLFIISDNYLQSLTLMLMSVIYSFFFSLFSLQYINRKICCMELSLYFKLYPHPVNARFFNIGF